MKVYFIQHEKTGYIKIGSAKNPQQRLLQLQIGCPDNLLLIAIAEDLDEKHLHYAFRQYRHRGEWFKPNPDLAKLISKHEYKKPEKEIRISPLPGEKRWLFDLVRSFGGLTRMSDATGIGISTIHQWRRRGQHSRVASRRNQESGTAAQGRLAGKLFGKGWSMSFAQNHVGCSRESVKGCLSAEMVRDKIQPENALRGLVAHSGGGVPCGSAQSLCPGVGVFMDVTGRRAVARVSSSPASHGQTIWLTSARR